MSVISVPIQINTHIPAPGLPRDISEPVHVSCVSLEARDWMWNGTNIVLVTVEGARTIAESVAGLRMMWPINGLRPVRADECVQLYDYAKDWPADWLSEEIGSRIFFPGSVFDLKYPDETFKRIFAARYDHEVQDWIIECEDTYVTLTSGDRFACVLDDPSKKVDEWLLKNSRSYPRRSLNREFEPPRSVRYWRANMWCPARK